MPRLCEIGLVERAGRTRPTRYFVPPAVLRSAGLDLETTLSRVERHRLRALVLENLQRFPDSGRQEIHRRIGSEIHEKAITRMLGTLVEEGVVVAEG